MSVATPLHNQVRRAPEQPRRGMSLRLLIPAVIAAALAISQFTLPWERPEEGLLVGLALGAILLIPNGRAWVLAPVLICELTIASYYFTAYGLSLRLIVSLLAVALAFPAVLQTNRADPLFRRVLMPTILLLVVATVGNLLTSGEAYMIKYLRYQVLQVLALVLVASIIRDRRDLLRVSWLSFGLLVAAALVAIWQHYARGSAIGSDLVSIWKGRSVGFGGSPVILANQMTVGMVVLLGVLVAGQWKRNWKLFSLIGALGLLAIGLYFTYTRSATLALAPGLLAMGLCLSGQRRTFMVGSVLGAAALFQLLSGTGIIGERYYRNAEDDSSAATHEALWQVGLAIAIDNMLTGVGHEHFEEISLGYADDVDSAVAAGSLGVERPHNDFLTVWISWGIVALVAYILIFVGAAKNFVAAARAPDPLVRCLAIGGVGWLATYAANSAFHNYLDSSTLLWVFAGLSVVLARIAREETAPRPPARRAPLPVAAR